MRVRVLFRTHYQIDQPGHFFLLVQECSSPIQSEYPERVAARLAKAAEFNDAAALYAVELARHAEILTERMLWTPLGLLIALVTRPAAELKAAKLELTQAERLAAFRVFLESDGACLLWLARRLVKDGEILATEETSNPIAREMFIDIYAQYLEFVQAPPERQGLRAERDRMTHDGFKGKTGKHKLWFHLEVLRRAGLCDRGDERGSRGYSARRDECLTGLRALQGAVPSVLDLEKRCSSGDLCDIACELMRPTLNVPAGGVLDEQLVMERVRATVRRIQGFGMNLSPISTIMDVIQIQATAEGLVAPKSRVIREVIQAMHRREPRLVRFHVDRSGRPAYLLVEE